jgi:hypothetical protein
MGRLRADARRDGRQQRGGVQRSSLVATVLIMPGKTFEDAFAQRNTGAVFAWTPATKTFRMLPGTRALGEQRHRDVARRSGVLCGLDHDEARRRVFARQTRRAAPHGAVEGVRPRQRALDGRQPFDYGRHDRQRAGLRWRTEDRGGHTLSARLRGGDDRSEDDGGDRAGARGRQRRRFTGTAIAMRVGNELWLGSFYADRLAYRALK